GAGPGQGSGGGGSGELGLDGDLDLVGDQHAPGLQGCVPGQAELLAGDRGLAGEAGAVGAEGVGGGALVGEVEHDGPGGAADGQVAVELVALELGGHEGQARVALGVEEVRAAQVVVAVLVAGGDRGGL